MNTMRKILLFLIFFGLGILTVLRCQYYNREASPESSFSEKLKNVVDGLIDDVVAVKDYIQKKTSKEGDPLPPCNVNVEKIQVDAEEPVATPMNAEGV